jgi:hypothetical protein
MQAFIQTDKKQRLTLITLFLPDSKKHMLITGKKMIELHSSYQIRSLAFKTRMPTSKVKWIEDAFANTEGVAESDKCCTQFDPNMQVHGQPLLAFAHSNLFAGLLLEAGAVVTAEVYLAFEKKNNAHLYSYADAVPTDLQVYGKSVLEICDNTKIICSLIRRTDEFTPEMLERMKSFYSYAVLLEMERRGIELSVMQYKSILTQNNEEYLMSVVADKVNPKAQLAAAIRLIESHTLTDIAQHAKHFAPEIMLEAAIRCTNIYLVSIYAKRVQAPQKFLELVEPRYGHDEIAALLNGWSLFDQDDSLPYEYEQEVEEDAE